MLHHLTNHVNNHIRQSSAQNDLFWIILVTLLHSLCAVSIQNQVDHKRDDYPNLKDHEYRHLIVSSSNRHQQPDLRHHDPIVGPSRNHLPGENRFLAYSSIMTEDDDENRIKYNANSAKKRQQLLHQLQLEQQAANNFNSHGLDRMNVKRDLPLQYYTSDLFNSTGLSSDCPNITKNNRFKCAKNLDRQFCACYKQAFNRWLNLSIFDKDQSTCCSRLEVRNCVELIFRSERRECKNRWEKESKRYAELVVPGKDHFCREYRKPEHCKQGIISITTIAILVIIGVLLIIACVGFAGYACYRKYTE